MAKIPYDNLVKALSGSAGQQGDSAKILSLLLNKKNLGTPDELLRFLGKYLPPNTNTEAVLRAMMQTAKQGGDKKGVQVLEQAYRRLTARASSPLAGLAGKFPVAGTASKTASKMGTAIDTVAVSTIPADLAAVSGRAAAGAGAAGAGIGAGTAAGMAAGGAPVKAKGLKGVIQSLTGKTKKVGKVAAKGGVMGPLMGALSGYVLGEMISRLFLRASNMDETSLQMEALAAQDRMADPQAMMEQQMTGIYGGRAAQSSAMMMGQMGMGGLASGEEMIGAGGARGGY